MKVGPSKNDHWHQPCHMWSGKVQFWVEIFIIQWMSSIGLVLRVQAKENLIPIVQVGPKI
jgi:hypothetical protein